jgi:integrase
MGSIRRRTDNNLLFLDFRYRDIRCREQTASRHGRQPEEVQKVLDRIEADIAAGTFDYRRYFPASKNAARFDAAPAVSVAVTVTAPSARRSPRRPSSRTSRRPGIWRRRWSGASPTGSPSAGNSTA